MDDKTIVAAANDVFRAHHGGLSHELERVLQGVDALRLGLNIDTAQSSFRVARRGMLGNALSVVVLM